MLKVTGRLPLSPLGNISKAPQEQKQHCALGSEEVQSGSKLSGQLRALKEGVSRPASKFCRVALCRGEGPACPSSLRATRSGKSSISKHRSDMNVVEGLPWWLRL